MPTVDILSYILQLDSKGFQVGAAQAEQKVKTLASTITSQLKTAVVGLAGAYFGAQGLRAAFNLTVGAAAEEEAALRRLSISIENTGASFRAAWPDISDTVEQMRELTAFSDDEMYPAIQMLTEMTGDYHRALKLLPNVLELAASRQISVMESAQLLGRVNGENLRRIGMMFPLIEKEADAFARLHPEANKAAYFLELVNRQTSGQAAAQLETNTGKIDNLWDNIKEGWEDFGKVILPAFTMWADISNNLEGKMPRAAADAEKATTQWQLLTKAMGTLFTFDLDKIENDFANLFASMIFGVEAVNKKIDATTGGTAGGAKPVLTPEQEQAIYDRRVAFEELYYSLKLRTAEQMMGFYKKELATFENNAKIKEAILKQLFRLELDIERRYAEIEARGMKLQGERHTTPSTGGGLVGATPYRGGGFQSGPEDQITAWDQMWNNLRVISQEGSDFLEGVFEGLMATLSTELREFTSMIVSALKGDFASAGASLVGIIASIFEGNSGAARRHREAMERLREEYERATRALLDMTEAERLARKAWVEAQIAIWESVPDLYMSPEHRELLENYRKELEFLNQVWEDEDVIRSIDNFAEMLQYLTDPENLDYQKGRNLISIWTDLFNLSIEQQIALWEQLRNTLEAAGGLTLDWEQEIDRQIKRLRDQAVTAQTPVTPESQIYRSVTIITERQANSMLAVLNTIRAVLQEISNKISQALSGLTLPTIAPGNRGGMTININADSTTTGTRVAREFVRELRARGVQVST